MKITGMHVTGFGAWNSLELDQLDEHVTVFYGPNEAGKTTLMNFARSVLYGFQTARRRRYVPPAQGGRAGGALSVATANGSFQVRRFANGDARYDEFSLLAPDGTVQSEHLLDVVLGGVDESIFNNVFAVGLREIQELGTLEDSEAARWLYDLSAGTDRVSLVDVMREVGSTREQILGRDAQPTQVSRLLAQRERLQGDIDRLTAEGQGYLRLIGERDELLREIAEREVESRELAQEARVMELGVSVAERWRRRAELDAQLANLGPAVHIPEDALERLARLGESVERKQRKHRGLWERYRQLRTDLTALGVSDALLRNAPRIEAIAEQTQWVNSLASQIRQLDGDVSSLSQDLVSEHTQLGLVGRADLDKQSLLNSRAPDTLAAAGKAVREAVQNLRRAKEESSQRDVSATSASAELEAALQRRGHRDLNKALEQCSGLVSTLRRRIQLDEKLDILKRDVAELEQRNHDLMHQQLLPPWPLVATGGVFVVGFVLLLVGVFMPWVLNLGWWLAALGLVGCGLASVAKLSLEKQSADSLEGCQKQLETARAQYKQVVDECKQLDRQLPPSGGPLAVRLQAAQRELGELESLTPIETRLRSVGQDTMSVKQRLAQARSEVKRAKSRWRSCLSAAGLPPEYSMRQVRGLLDRRDRVSDLRRRCDLRKDELTQKHQEFQALTQRVRQLATDAAMPVLDESPADTIGRLITALRGQQALVDRREAQRQQVRHVRRQAGQVARHIRQLERQRREMFIAVGAADETDYRRLAASYTQIMGLRKQREQVHTEVMATLTGLDCEHAISRLMIDHSPARLETEWQELKEKIASVDLRLKELYQARGEIQAQIKTAASDQRLSQAQLDLGCVDQQLHDSLAKWQVLAVTNHVLDSMRSEYETDRQPETLIEASKYLQQMTEGRYRRVWTPLTERLLRVEDAAGQSLPVEVLSSGTREQLFLSLRLAMAALYARRGVMLPLILDDVLVNFDAQRAKAAAKVLCEFARQGHQLLLFTCHEHIAAAFRELHVDVRRLPTGRAEPKVTVAPEPEIIYEPIEYVADEPPVFHEPIVVEPPPQRLLPRPPKPRRTRRMQRPSVRVERPEPVVVEPPRYVEPVRFVEPPRPAPPRPVTPVRYELPIVERPQPAPPPQPIITHIEPPPPKRKRRTRQIVVTQWKQPRWDPAIEVPIDDAVEVVNEESQWSALTGVSADDPREVHETQPVTESIETNVDWRRQRRGRRSRRERDVTPRTTRTTSTEVPRWWPVVEELEETSLEPPLDAVTPPVTISPAGNRPSRPTRSFATPEPMIVDESIAYYEPAEFYEPAAPHSVAPASEPTYWHRTVEVADPEASPFIDEAPPWWHETTIDETALPPHVDWDDDAAAA